MKRVLVVLAAILLAFLVWRVASVLHRKIIAANEYAVVAHLKAVLQAQNEYSYLNGGLYGDIECLAHPGSCLPVDASDSEPLLDASVALAELRGSYRFVFVPHYEPTRQERNTLRRKGKQPPLDPDNIPVRYLNYAYMAIPRLSFVIINPPGR